MTASRGYRFHLLTVNAEEGQQPIGASMIFNVMERDYWLLASFTDMWECKEYLDRSEKAHWVAVFPDGSAPMAIPVWEAEEFIYNFPHEVDVSGKGRTAYIY